MVERDLLILERSSQNLQKITRNGKTMLEGVFAEFGIENRNGRIYEEKEYLPHLEYLKKDIATGNLLGELDHPERFEVALTNVSHRITELWYDQQKRQVLGRIEIIEGTPKGQIAKSLLEAGVPLSISSRAAGTVNEDKTVAIQQIYTYDLVAKPGFESAQLHTVNESANPYAAELNKTIQSLNESITSRKNHSINSQLGVINENVSVIDLTGKVPITWHGKPGIREEAQKLIKNNKKEMAENKPELMNEDTFQQWTLFIKKEISAINERLEKIEQKGSSEEIAAIKEYVEKIRKIQEDSLNWSSEIAKAVNEVATYADTLAEKSNKHYKLTNKIVETVDHNAKTLNATQDWTSEVAKVTNAIGKTVDHNAKMLNGMNEWTKQIAKGVNSLNEWGTEKAKAINNIHDWVGSQAKAINGMHEWTSDIAKNLNNSVNWSEDQFGKAISKEDAAILIEYIETVAESKKNPELKAKIDEMLKTNSITSKPLNEANIKGIAVINADNLTKLGMDKSKVNQEASLKKETDVHFDEKTHTIISKLKTIKLGKEKLPVGNDKLQMDPNKAGAKINAGGGIENSPKELKTNLQTTTTHKTAANGGPSGPKNLKSQNLKLNEKPGGKNYTNEDKLQEIKDKKSSLDEKLSSIITTIEKEKKVDESIKSSYPFTSLLSEEDRKRFASLDEADKQKVNAEIEKFPTTDSKIIVKLWESALGNKKENQEPLWLRLAPKKYREAFNAASDLVKESIKAKTEFFPLDTTYQIENFWETSGLVSKPNLSLNESISAITPEETEQKLDTFVAGIGEYMKNRYNN